MTDTKVVPLEPCPFCGGDNLLERAVPNTQGNRHYIACYNSKCLAEGPWSWAPRTASEQWNRRAAPAHPLTLQCPTCAGNGRVVLGVSRSMALDAGEPQMEGMDMGPEYGNCPECNGTGAIINDASIPSPAHPSQQLEGLVGRLLKEAEAQRLLVQHSAGDEELVSLLREAAAALTPPAPQEGETPRVNALLMHGWQIVSQQAFVDLARQLERELNARDHLTSPHHTANRDQGAVVQQHQPKEGA